MQRDAIEAARPTPKKQRGHVRALDGYRALAIIAIVLYHLDVTWLPSGHLGVIMFLVLTGYLVTSSLLKRLREGVLAIPRFWLGRLARIWLPMAVMIAGTVLACVIGNHVLLTKAKPDILPGLALVENVSYILRNVSYFEQIGGPSPLTHLWYLGVDAQFCLIWPLLMIIFSMLPSRTIARRLCLVLAVASAVAMGVLFNPAEGVTRVYYGPDTRAFAPLVGAWLAYVMPVGRRPARDLRSLIEESRLLIEGAGILSVILLVVGMVLVADTSVLLYRGGMMLATLLSAIIIATLVMPGGLLSTLLSLPPLTWLGSRSFGIYLWHYPLIQLFGATDTRTPAPMIALCVVLTLVLAELTYRLIEQPVARGFGSKASRTDNASQDGAFALLGSPIGLAAGALAALVVVADIIGVMVIKDETLIPEDAIVNTGEAVDRAMDLTQQQRTRHVGADLPPTEAVLYAPDSEKSNNIYDPVLIGDSVPGDAEEFWLASCPDGHMDSYVGRHPSQALTVLDDYLAQGVVGKIVILQAFSNSPVTDDELNHMIEACGPDRIVYLVNVRIPEAEETQINQTLAAGAERYENVHLIDWYGFSEGHPDWLYEDGEHLTPAGQPAYIGMIVNAISEDFIANGGTVARQGETVEDVISSNREGVDDAATTDSATSTDSAQETDANTSGDAAATTDSQASSESAAQEGANDADASAVQQAGLRVLMLGNSFTYYNGLPSMLADMTGAEVVMHAKGGATLSEQLDPQTSVGALTLEALDEGNWDYVVLQEKSYLPIVKHRKEYLMSVDELAERVKASGATPIIYATWSYQDGAERLDKLGLTSAQMDEELSDSFQTATQESGAIMADVEHAFSSAAVHNLLFAEDGVHPSSIGSRLAAEVIAQAIRDDQSQKDGAMSA